MTLLSVLLASTLAFGIGAFSIGKIADIYPIAFQRDGSFVYLTELCDRAERFQSIIATLKFKDERREILGAKYPDKQTCLQETRKLLAKKLGELDVVAPQKFELKPLNDYSVYRIHRGLLFEPGMPQDFKVMIKHPTQGVAELMSFDASAAALDFNALGYLAGPNNSIVVIASVEHKLQHSHSELQTHLAHVKLSPSKSDKVFAIQLGSYPNRDEAAAKAKELNGEIAKLHIREAEVPGKGKRYQVLTEYFHSKELAAENLNLLRAEPGDLQKFKDAFIQAIEL